MRRHARRSQRRGVLYVAVLGVAMIMTMIALASLHVARVELKTTAGESQFAAAENAAYSAVELALARICADSNWRTTYASGQEVPQNDWITLGNAKLKFVLTDDDGNLSDNARDYVTIRGIGSSGEAVAAASVEVEPSGAALTCLETSFHAGDDVTLLGNIATDQFVSANDRIAGILFLAGRIEGDAVAQGAISSSVTVTGNKFTGVPLRDMPDADHVFKYYLANGTHLDVSAVPNARIDKAVLSAESNPYGPTNPQGIYVIHCGATKLTIADSRLQATLVVISTAMTDVDNRINWTSPAPNQPALLVRGSLNLAWDGGNSLSESGLNTNFNPSGTSLMGPTDSDKNDSYPGLIKGMVYATGDVWITNAHAQQGNLVAGVTVTLSDNAWLNYDGSPFNFPPPGFSKGSTMRIVPGTWKRTTR